MNMCKTFGFVGMAAAGLLLAGQASATPCPAGMQGSPVCIATTSHNEPALADLFGAGGTGNSLFSSGPGINPYTDQTTPSSYWSVNGTGGSENTLILTLSSNSPRTTFGIFDPTAPTNRLVLFDAATAGYSTTLKTDGHGGFAATYFASTDPLAPSTGHETATFNSGNLFGYYLNVVDKNGVDHTFYSDSSRNTDGTDRVVAYNGDGVNTVAMTNGKFFAGEYLLAWEDGTDLDYNDFIVMVESVHPVPEPAALGMFGLGLLLLGGAVAFRRRREGEVA